MVQYLVEKGANTNATDHVNDNLGIHRFTLVITFVQGGETALHGASSSVSNKAMEIIATLLKYGADLSAVNKA